MRWLAMPLLLATATVAVAQTREETYPSTIAGHGFVGYSLADDGSMKYIQFHFQPSGQLLSAMTTQENRDLGSGPKIALTRWMVRYPNYPQKTPHELCIGNPPKKDWLCKDFQFEGKSLMYGETELSAIGFVRYPQ